MSRYNEEARITFNGDRALAARYVSEGRKYLGGLMVTSPQQTAVRELTNPDGVHFRVGYFNGVPFIEITAGRASAPEYRLIGLTGFMIAPRTMAAVTAYSSEPYTFLTPKKDPSAAWASYFKSDPGALTVSTHPAFGYIDPVSIYGDMFGSAPASNFTAAKKTQVNNSAAWQYWTDTKRTLFVEYKGSAYCQSPNAFASAGPIVVNGKIVCSTARFNSMMAELLPAKNVRFILGAAAKRTRTGLDIYVCAHAATTDYINEITVVIFKFSLIPSADEATRLDKLVGVANVRSYAAEFIAADDDTPATLITSYNYNSPSSVQRNSSFAFSPRLDEGRTLIWPRTGTTTAVKELKYDFGDDAWEEIDVGTIGLRTETRTAAHGPYLDFGDYVGDPLSFDNLIPTGDNTITIVKAAGAPVKCAVDYSRNGLPMYGYYISGARNYADVAALTYEYSRTWNSFWSITEDSDLQSSHTRSLSDVYSSFTIYFPNYDENGVELPTNWLEYVNQHTSILDTDSGAFNFHVNTPLPPVSGDVVTDFERTRTVSSTRTDTLQFISHIDMKTRSAAIGQQVEVTTSGSFEEWSETSPSTGDHELIPSFPTTNGSSGFTRTVSKKYIANGSVVHNTGNILTRSNPSSFGPSVGAVSGLVYYYAYSWYASTVIFTQPASGSNSYSASATYPSAEYSSFFAFSSEPDAMAVINSSYVITGVVPYSTNLATGAVSYNGFSVTNFGANGLSQLDYMLGNHPATRYTAPLLISSVAVRIQINQQGQ